MNSEEKKDTHERPTPFASKGEALAWLQCLIGDANADWRIEIGRRFKFELADQYVVRAYDMNTNRGWHSGEATTLREALAWLRYGIEGQR